MKVLFGEYTLDLAKEKLSKSGALVPIQLTPLKVLIALVRANGDIVSHDSLRQMVWRGRTVDFERSLHTAIKHVRRALGDDPRDPQYVQTVSRHGYRLLSPVILDTPPSSASPRRDTRFHPSRGHIAAAALALIVSALAILTFATKPAAPVSPSKGLALDEPRPGPEHFTQRQLDRRVRRERLARENAVR